MSHPESLSFTHRSHFSHHGLKLGTDLNAEMQFFVTVVQRVFLFFGGRSGQDIFTSLHILSIGLIPDACGGQSLHST
jgi:hypothetical protein